MCSFFFSLVCRLREYTRSYYQMPSINTRSAEEE